MHQLSTNRRLSSFVLISYAILSFTSNQNDHGFAKCLEKGSVALPFQRNFNTCDTNWSIDWVPVITLSGLILWILTSFFLLLEYKEYLVERAPWTIIAVLGPVSVWSAIVVTREIDFYYAGLFTPAWIGVGLIILAAYDGRKCPDRLDGAGKGQVDVERGIRRRDSDRDETGGAPANRKSQGLKTNHPSSRELSQATPTSQTVAGMGRTTAK